MDFEVESDSDRRTEVVKIVSTCTGNHKHSTHR